MEFIKQFYNNTDSYGDYCINNNIYSEDEKDIFEYTIAHKHFKDACLTIKSDLYSPLITYFIENFLIKIYDHIIFEILDYNTFIIHYQDISDILIYYINNNITYKIKISEQTYFTNIFKNIQHDNINILYNINAYPIGDKDHMTFIKKNYITPLSMDVLTKYYKHFNRPCKYIKDFTDIFVHCYN